MRHESVDGGKESVDSEGGVSGWLGRSKWMVGKE